MIKDFWENCHELGSIRYLTGSSGQEIWQELKIEDRIIPGSNVLNIGVGTGRCTVDLKNVGVNVSVLDISQSAVEKVSSLCEHGYLSSGALPENYFDLAISHLVAQHMNDNDLTEQIRKVLLSLKDIGLFAIQIACPINNIPTLKDNIEFKMQEGSVLRTSDEIVEIVKQANGRIIFMEPTREFPHYGSVWLTVHIIKK
jgi:cyclopropane fatty-acyl-phospholipid synthase-like methyltransferase